MTRIFAPLLWVFGGYDRVRPIELLSALVAIGFGGLTIFDGAILERDSYGGLGAGFSVLLVVVGLCQASVMAGSGPRWRPVRCGMLLYSATSWGGLAYQFWVSGVLTTAITTYACLALLCSAAALFLALHSWR